MSGSKGIEATCGFPSPFPRDQRSKTFRFHQLDPLAAFEVVRSSGFFMEMLFIMCLSPIHL